MRRTAPPPARPLPQHLDDAAGQRRAWIGPRHPGAALTLLLLCLPLPGQSAGYRVEQRDGSVVYTDQVPAQARRVETLSYIKPRSATAASAGELPPALQAVVQRHPATLYTGPGCGVCERARQWLEQRGVPYTELLVRDAQDAVAMRARAGADAGSLPFLTLGEQRIGAFDADQWSRQVDAAGYPARSVLPTAYRNPEPRPASGGLAQPAAAAPAAAPLASPLPAAAGGIQF